MSELTHPAPYASWETRGWWEGAGRGELVLQRCTSCGIVQHKPRAICVKCLTDTIEHFVASGRGTVHTFTVTHQNGVAPFSGQLPYVLAYVELEEGPKVLTNIVTEDPAALRIGQAVRADFATTPRDDGEAIAVPLVPAGMILDLHTHSVASDDGRAKVDNYCQWIKRKELPLDGIVLTEHRQFDAESDYRALEDQYGLLILKASEVETDYGHCLVFGVNEDLVHAFDFARIDNPLGDVIEAANRCGGFAAPCHPGRRNVGLFAHYEERPPVEGVEVVEIYNGGSIPGEDERAVELAARYGYRGIGGSDSHIVSRIGLCATEFADDIVTIDDLVTALRAGRCEARTWRT